MSAPLIYILVPAVLAGILLIASRWYRITVLASVLITLLMALLAGLLPVEKFVELGPWVFKVSSTLSVLGRHFVLLDSDRPLLVFIYTLAAFWFGAAFAAKAGRMLAPLGLLMIALWTAALAVEPFLYAALLIEIAALVSVPILAPTTPDARRGVLRFLIFQTLGMPFFLFTGWLLSGVDVIPGDLTLVARAASLLGFGFALWLAVFPFHTWVLNLAQHAQPYAATFVFLMLPWMVALFGLGFLDQYAWLRNSLNTYTIIRYAGLLFVVPAGLWVAFERHLGRILGYAVLIETGFSLLAISTRQGIPLYFALMLPRALALGVWALALAGLRHHVPDLWYRDVQGLARRAPVLTAGLVLAHFTVAGLPLLAAFPVRLALYEQLAQSSMVDALLALMGSTGLLIVGLRTLAVLVMGPEDSPWQRSETWAQIGLLSLGILAIFLVGLFPQFFIPPLLAGLQSFPHLSP